MLRRLALLASLLAAMGALALASAASAEELSFEAPVTGVGKWLFRGPLALHDGHFEDNLTSGSGRMLVWGKVEGNRITVSGQIKVPGLITTSSHFSIEGEFQGNTFTGNFTAPIEFGAPFRGQVTVTRPQSQTTEATGNATGSISKQPDTVVPKAPAQPTAMPDIETPESLEPKLSRAQRQGVQQQLTVLGFYDHAVDGSFGPGTRAAIRKFQLAYDLAATGYLDAKEIRILKEGAAAKETEIAAATAQQAEQQVAAKKLADEKAAQEKAEADRKAADEKARAVAAKLEADRQALEAQKAELKRQQEELAKSQQQAEPSKDSAATTTAPSPEQATAAATPTETLSAAATTEAPPAAPGDFTGVLATLQPIDEVYVATRPAKIRSAPNVAAARVGTLNVGDKIQVLGRLPGQDWFLVARDDQPIGYVVASQLASEADATRATPGAAATTGQSAATAETAQPTVQQAALPPELANLDYGNYHALVIGNDMYRTLPRLGTAVGDAEAVAKELERNYHFNVRLLTNANEEDIIGALSDLRRELAWDDNLLIYYAGHGWYDRDAEQGYWLPVDASEDNQAHWISNADITNALKALKAKHILVVADSCYSGTLARNANISLRGIDYIERIVKKKARTVLTSGGLEPVLDAGGEGHSVFARAFLAALEENDGVIDGQEVFRRLRDPVVANAPQTPEYGEIRGAGHDGGDFIFVRR